MPDKPSPHPKNTTRPPQTPHPEPHPEPPPNEQKAALRSLFRATRQSLPSDERVRLSARIVSHLERWLDSQDAKPACVALYLAASTEVSLDALIEPLLARGVRVAAPRGDGFALIETPSTCATIQGQNWRVPGGVAVEAEELDVILVPGLAFGRDGSRLGQGGGWFDRALLGSRAILVGVAFECQIVDALPTQAHDVAVQWIAIEDGVRASVQRASSTCT